MQIYKGLFMLLLIGCTATPAVKNMQKDQPNAIAEHTQPVACNYETRKAVCKKLLSSYKTNPALNKEQQLVKFISDSLFPCWYGTKWDYNGTTTQPGTGSIACGYFVTTLLQHAGLKLNRERLAQCPSSFLIESTCSGISKYSNKPIEYFVDQIKTKGIGLYVAGLDNHTGFIYNDGTEVYFIHSSWYMPRCVIKEKAITSVALRNTKFRMTGRIHF